MPQHLVISILPSGALLPEFRETPEPLDPFAEHAQQEIWQSRQEAPESWLLLLGFRPATLRLSPSLAFWRDFAATLIQALRTTPDLEDLREQVTIEPDPAVFEALLQACPPMAGADYLTPDLLARLWDEMLQAFRTRIAAFPDSVAAFFHQYSPEAHLAGRVFFHLVENPKSAAPFAFLATYSSPAKDGGKARHLPLKHALVEYADEKEKLLELLATVHLAARRSKVLAELLERGTLFHPLGWDSRQALAFLRDIPIFEQAGILCRIPNWWTTRATRPRVQLSVGDNAPSKLGMDAILKLRPRLFLGDCELTVEEARQLLQETEGLALIKNRWVAVDPEKLRCALEAYEQTGDWVQQGLSLREAMRLQLSPQQLPHAEEVEFEISNGDWLQSVYHRLRHPEKLPDATLPPTFRAHLRPYQQDGLKWLLMLDSLHLGACLADDMGLGKTIQLLALLSILRQQRDCCTLLVLPASLLANWQEEARRFAPDLRLFIAHPDAHRPRRVPPLTQQSVARYDLVITTYSLTHRYEWLGKIEWDYIVLDEAQAIRNPATRQTRAIKKLPAANRIVMTGTPVENRLSDLWSLFDFLNPGLLGSVREFKAFAKKLVDNPDGYARLRKIVAPYILRRLKTDRNVISDLPDKVEMKTYAELSKKQLVLYNDHLDNLKRSMEELEGMQRRGLILAALTRFKQICNHPDQYLDGGAYAAGDSGKFARLREICDVIREKRESMLVFTQFKEMTGPLHDFLAEVFGRDGLILHGSVPTRQRRERVAQFQDPNQYVPFMILSIKAGGVGLNLTAANHVIHFDRWWNPAVENQASDRAFRIGQKKKVLVHKFITRGTVEERIDEMLEEKKDLFNRVIAASGEKWITEMDNEEILNLFTLKL